MCRFLVDMAEFAPFPRAWQATRPLLREHAAAMTALPRFNAPPHAEWWHVALLIGPSGLSTEAVPLPGGGAIHLRMDLTRHQVLAEGPTGTLAEWGLDRGMSGAQLSEAIASLAADHGLAWEGTAPSTDSPAGEYDPKAAASFWSTVVAASNALGRHVARLPGTGAVPHFWPHGFDLSVEWFGRRRAPDENGVLLPTRITFGLDPGSDDQYFYANPWPFDEALLGHDLPHGATWHTEGWVGSMLPYRAVVGDPEGLTRLGEYASAVSALASPDL